jgi:multiple sugar transport system permease protein
VSFFKRQSVQDTVRRTIVHLVLAGIGFVLMIPFLWMLSSSLKSEAEIFRFPPTWIPERFLWHNWSDALQKFPIVRSVRNTMFIVLGSMAGTLISGSLTAFAFARLRFRARDALFLLVLSTMMIPVHVTLIPQYILFTKLKWIDSFKPLIVPAFFGGGAYTIFLLRQFFMTIPIELDDAARIDGCSSLQIYWRIMLPLSKPALSTIAIFNFMGNWNAFLGPLIYLDDPKKHTLSIALSFFQQSGAYMPERTWSHLMVMSLVSVLPCLILFFFAQRIFIQGVVISGVKG